MLRISKPILAFAIVMSVASTRSAHAVDDAKTVVESETGAWRYVPTLPIGRSGPSCDYDPIHDRMLIHGGYGYPQYRNDAWELTLGEVPDWDLITPSGSAPTLTGTAHIFDPVRDRWILFGGGAFYPDYQNTTWALSSGNAPAWTSLTPAGVLPSPRVGAVGAYDRLQDRMIVFGGGAGGSTYKNDVQALDLASTTWSEVIVAGVPPSPRTSACAIYDGTRDRLVVFGGTDGAASSNEVWTVNFSGMPTWTLLSISGSPPTARYGAGAVYDSIGDKMVVFGGVDSSGIANDTWSLSLASGEWSLLVPETDGPPKRSGFGWAYDSKRRRILVFGGTQYYDGVRDTWELSLANPSVWNVVHPGDAPGIGGAPMVVDPIRDRLIMLKSGGPLALDLGPDRWSRLQPSGTQPTLGPAILDPQRDRLVLYGGASASALSFDPLAWTPLVTTGPSPGGRSGHSVVFDSQRQRLLLFGGAYNADVYALDLATSTWATISPVGGSFVRYDHAAIYDPVRDRMIVVGGPEGGDPFVPPQVWALPLAGTPAWTQLVPAGSIAAARSPWQGMYDPILDRMLVYGGDFDRFRPARGFALALSGPPQWTALTASPVATYQGAMIAGDPARNRMLLYGGASCTGLGTCSYNTELYELSFAASLPVPEPIAPALHSRLTAIRPNPGRDAQSIELRIAPDDGPATLEIFSVTGQRVWSRNLGTLTTGSHTLRWNGEDARGVRCAPGVYWAALRTGGGAHAMRFVRVR